jgi:hypothetical protein
MSGNPAIDSGQTNARVGTRMWTKQHHILYSVQWNDSNQFIRYTKSCNMSYMLFSSPTHPCRSKGAKRKKEVQSFWLVSWLVFLNLATPEWEADKTTRWFISLGTCYLAKFLAIGLSNQSALWIWYKHTSGPQAHTKFCRYMYINKKLIQVQDLHEIFASTSNVFHGTGYIFVKLIFWTINVAVYNLEPYWPKGLCSKNGTGRRALSIQFGSTKLYHFLIC